MPLVINGRFLTRPITGVERHGRALLQVLARSRPDARVIVPRSATRVDAFGLDVVPHGIGSGHWWEQSALPTALRKDDLLLSPANTGPLRVRRQVVVVHDLAFLHQPEWFDRRFVAWYDFLLPRLARRCAGVIAVSDAMRTEVGTTLGLSTERIHVVPPFHTLRTGPGPDALPARPYLLLVGAHDPRKGADRVIAWYRQLHAPAFDLVLVGRRHRAFARPPLYPIRHVHVLPDVEDEQLAGLYAHALALIHASTYEGFGLPVLEALAAGCPVIAHDLPVLREQFGDALHYADVDDPPAMQAALSALGTSSVREAHITRGRERAAAFTPERTLHALDAVIVPLLAR